MKRLGILFGGRSAEHEISILSAASVMAAIDVSRYEIIPIGINKNGEWFHITADMRGLNSLEDSRIRTLIPPDTVLAGGAQADGSSAGAGEFPGAVPITVSDFDRMTDFAFPVLHGPFGEDGSIQGLFEMLNKPYGGCGVTSCALSMDKILTKEIWRQADLPLGRFAAVIAANFHSDPERELSRIEDAVPYPAFVKPANMGSSVGVSKARDRAELAAAIRVAVHYDRRVIIEEATVGRELEIAMLGNDAAQSSVVGEIVIQSGLEFYDYDAKYRSEATRLFIPADIPKEISARIAELAAVAWRALDGAGYARIDCFYDEKHSKIYLNEMNAIPGFTSHSMFPLLWKEAGVPYADLIERIITLGYERYHAKNNR